MTKSESWHRMGLSKGPLRYSVILKIIIKNIICFIAGVITKFVSNSAGLVELILTTNKIKNNIVFKIIVFSGQTVKKNKLTPENKTK